MKENKQCQLMDPFIIEFYIFTNILNCQNSVSIWKKTCFCGFWLMFPKTEQDLPSFNHAYFYYEFDLIIHSLWASYIPTFNKRNIFFQTNYIQLTKNWIQMRVVFVNKKKHVFKKLLCGMAFLTGCWLQTFLQILTYIYLFNSCTKLVL